MPKIDAANWIPVREDLETDSRVLAIAEAITPKNRHYVLGPVSTDLLGDDGSVTRDVMRDVTIVALLRVWAAFTHHTRDGSIHHAATIAHLDTIARLRGFGQAMSTVGWAVHDPATRTITLPNFTEYNAPNKNGQRAKTAHALRQARYKARLAAKAQATINQEGHQSDDQASPVTSPVTSLNEKKDVTPSISISHSISESESESKTDTPVCHSGVDPDPLGTLKKKIDTLRPAWKKMPAWSCEDEAALLAALPNLVALEDKDWLMLVNYMKWANSTANQGKDSHKVTSRRHSFLESLPSYLDRATTHWKQQGCPKLDPAAKTARTPAKPSPEPVPELPPAQNAAAFAGLLTDLGIKRTPKPAAA